jgi:signal transduction histidine kinase
MFRPTQTGVLIFLMAFAVPGFSTAANDGVLTNAAEVLSLTSAQAARRISVSVTGVVTVAEPNWGGKFFLQDSTGGVFVNNNHQPQPKLGDLVQVKGVSDAGSYAPDIAAPHWKLLGTAPLPEAKPVSIDQLMSGAEDGMRVEVSSVVRSAQPSQIVSTRMKLELASGGYRFRAFPPLSANVNPNSLVGATVRLRGTAAASFNAPLRDIRTVVMFVPRKCDLIIEHLPNKAISREPFAPLNAIEQYRRGSLVEPRIRVRGVVTYQRPDEDIFLHDKTGGLRVECHETNVFAPGQIVEAIGFPGLEHFLPVLQDAILIPTGESEKPIVPERASVQALLEGYHDSDLISLRGELLDRSLQPGRSGDSLSNKPGVYSLTLRNSNYLFSVEAPADAQFAKLASASIPIGSTLEVAGICLQQTDENGQAETCRILLTDPASIRVLQRPSWWTPRRLLTGIGILLAVSLVGLTWTIMIHRKNSALELSIAEKIKAREELQIAHDQLEQRVRERTRELKFEMGARQEAEVRVKAILAERTRIAQELHDTLLQGFTGIGLKLEALTSSLPSSLEATKGQLQRILDRSDEYLVEARRAVWELRSPSLEKAGTFSKALSNAVERALASTGIRLNFSVSGAARELEPAIEDNLLRICEEAVTNAVKHARPTHVEVNLGFTDAEVQLRVRDDGRGFDPQSPESSKAGHFGLAGIRERVKSLSGNFSLNSRPGEGTELTVTVRPG